MNHLGEFSTHRRDGDYVTKQLTSRHPAGKQFVAAVTRTGKCGMQSYLDSLCSAGVRLPAELHIAAGQPLTIQHRWVAGTTLLDAARTRPVAFPAAIAEIGRWIRSVSNTDARIDSNLANFCLWDGRPVLVDVLPPLIPSLRPVSENLFGELFTALCFDTPITLDALIGYAVRALLRAGNQPVARQLVSAVGELIDDTAAAGGFPATWFRARRTLAVRAACGEASTEQVQELFDLTSVLAFRRLDEPGRRIRVEQADQRIRELGVR